ncbi:MAG: hypothetical protein QNK37_04760 [Acidobacteriota bacterium]|nr:hypothetical protein [Acidobacteriota bacterium]
MLLWTSAFLVLGVGKTSLWTFEEVKRFDHLREDMVLTDLGVTLSVSDEGWIYVVDRENDRIYLIDPEGVLVKTVTGDGQGPGYVPRLIGIHLTKNGLIAKTSYIGTLYWHYFDRRLNFKEKKTFTARNERKVSGGVQIAYDQTFMFGYCYDPKVYTLQWAQLMDQEGKLVKELGTFSAGLSDKGWMPGRNLDHYASVYQFERADQPYGFGVISRGGVLFFADNTDYKIQHYNRRGEQSSPIVRNWDKRRRVFTQIDRVYEEFLAGRQQLGDVGFSYEVVTKAFREAKMRPFFPPILGMHALDDGSLLVVRDHDLKTGRSWADFFDAQGVFRGEVHLPKATYALLGPRFHYATKLVIRHDFAYVLEMDEEGEHELVIYRCIEDKQEKAHEEKIKTQ